MDARLQSLLDARARRSQLRRLTLPATSAVDFSSNGYLSLSSNPHIRASFSASLTAHQSANLLGSGGSRLLDGNTAFAEALEAKIAHTHGAPAGLLFNSGFDANAGVFSCIAQPDDVVLYDALVHASVHDGLKLSRCRRQTAFAHNSVAGLRAALGGLDEAVRGGGAGHVFVAVEGIYSMDGDVCPLREMVQCVEEMLPRGNGHVIVDEAHSTGVLGGGLGLVSELGLEERVFVRVHTFGKAMGCSGAAVLSSAVVRSYLINYARSFIYTTAPPLTSLLALDCTYTFLTSPHFPGVLAQLHDISAYARKALAAVAGEIGATLLSAHNSPVIAVVTPQAKQLAEWCQGRGFLVRAIVAPTVPRGEERVRVCVHAGNTREEVDGLVRVMERMGRRGRL